MRAQIRKSESHVTVEEFLDWPGDGTAKRYQLFDGEIRAMAPASPVHGRIQARLGARIDQRLTETGSRCVVLSESAVVPRAGAKQNLRVPDLLVTCSLLEAGQIVVTDPILLVEILSPGNEADTRQNVWAYTTIPSLREILVVHSTRVGAEILRRGPDGAWPDNPNIIAPGGLLRLESVDLSCPLADLYNGTHLA